MIKSNYDCILETSEFFLLRLSYVRSFNFLFLFHDLPLDLAMLRQLIVKYSCPLENVVVAVLLTWRGHGNIFIIITQPVLYLILSCWNKKKKESVTDFLGKSSDSAPRTDEITVEVFLSERRCWAFKCLYVLCII